MDSTCNFGHLARSCCAVKSDTAITDLQERREVPRIMSLMSATPDFISVWEIAIGFIPDMHLISGARYALPRPFKMMVLLLVFLRWLRFSRSSSGKTFLWRSWCFRRV